MVENGSSLLVGFKGVLGLGIPVECLERKRERE